MPECLVCENCEPYGLEVNRNEGVDCVVKELQGWGVASLDRDRHGGSTHTHGCD